MPEQTKDYLKKLAAGYTIRGELISLHKFTHFIFGDECHTDFPGGDSRFFLLLKAIISQELEIQKVRFVADNRRDDISRDAKA